MFCNHYRIVSELEIQNYDIPKKNRQIKYNEDDVRKDFEKQLLSCDNCNNVIPTLLDVKSLYGDTGVNIHRQGDCKCGHHTEKTLRFKHGYFMVKEPNGNWSCIMPEYPLILCWIMNAYTDLQIIFTGKTSHY